MTLGPILGHSTIETAYQEVWCAHVSILLGSGICASASAALNLRRTEDLGLSSNTGLYGRSGSFHRIQDYCDISLTFGRFVEQIVAEPSLVVAELQ